MIYHVVLTKFTEASEAEIKSSFQGAAGLRDAIPQLAEVRAGLIDPSEDAAYDAIYHFGFRERADFDAFMQDEAHHRYVADVTPILADFVAYDYADFDPGTSTV